MPNPATVRTRKIRPRVAVKSTLLGILGLLLLSMNQAGAAVEFEIGNGLAFDSLGLSTSIVVPDVDNRILLVGFGSVSRNFVDIVPTSLRFGGADLTHLGGVVQNVFVDWYARTDIYYLLNPNVGLNTLDGDVNAARPTGSSQQATWGMYGMVLSGAAQTAPQLVFTANQNPAAPSTTVGGTVTTTTADAMLVGFTALYSSFGNLFSTTGVTEAFDTGAGILNFGAAYKPVSAPTEAFTWTTNGYSTGIGTVAIAEVAPAVTVVPLPQAVVLFMSALIALSAGRRKLP